MIMPTDISETSPSIKRGRAGQTSRVFLANIPGLQKKEVAGSSDEVMRKRGLSTVGTRVPGIATMVAH